MSIRNVAMLCVRLLSLAALGQGAYWAAVSAAQLMEPKVIVEESPLAGAAFVSLAFMGSECFRVQAYGLNRNVLRRIAISAAITIICAIVAHVAAGPTSKMESAMQTAADDAARLILGVVLFGFLAFAARVPLDSRTSSPATADNASEGK